ncbi:putative MFS-type transporter [Cercospora beticola]|uniref:Putative MFS-type transporter n=1 Tax=Cercospora beticola TaxID=122368 RepID=A0A2G5HNN9_CERBT|nr:putative MFS-type transporter [Cercospora beticola]PIA94177.1 putative MFS-type transporter [Cercospora beticola]WPB04604.1 hypothetical protein RHO25_009250 [Cercospora beticola]CAK1364350.1 unnamed protein product [Cercospora beticola]
MSFMDEKHQSPSSFRASTLYILLCCCVASFSDVFTYAVLPPVIPFALPEKAGAPQDQVQKWVAILPAVTAGATVLASPFAGWMGDHCSRRKPLFVAAIFFQWVGIALVTAGQHIALWISGLVMFGIASAVVWATSLALIIDQVAREKVAQSLGFTGLSLSLGIFLGPVLGGLIYEHAGHYAVWGTVFGVSVVDLLLRMFLIESPKAIVPGRHSSPAHRFAALQLFRSPRMVCALLGAFAQATILTSFDASLTIHVGKVFGWKSTAAGLLYLAFCLPSFASPAIGMLADRFGAKLVLFVAFLLSTPVLASLQFVQTNDISDKVLLVALLLLLGALLGSTICVFSAEVSHVVSEMAERTPGIWGHNGAFAQAEALWWASYTLGLAVGPLWGGFVQDAADWSVLSLSLALLSLVASLPVIVFVGGTLSFGTRPGRTRDAPSGNGSFSSTGIQTTDV